MRPTLPVLVIAGLIGLAPAGGRAETFHTCAGFITSLPAVITTQGVWCMDKDLATSLAGGAAITIDANNVTLDCNDFKLGGLAAGAGTATRGIFSMNRLNATVRNCNVRGFFRGVELGGALGGHLVEDNRFDGNTYSGVLVTGDGNVVRRNRIFDTGGTTIPMGSAEGIVAIGATVVSDNFINGLSAQPVEGNASAKGISVSNGPGSRVSGNLVRGMTGAGTGLMIGVGVYSEGSEVAGNQLVGPGDTGVECGFAGMLARDNLLAGFANPVVSCTDGGNATLP